MFRGDGRRAQKLENRWNCLNSFVRGCRLVREQTGLLFDDFTIHDDRGIGKRPKTTVNVINEFFVTKLRHFLLP